MALVDKTFGGKVWLFRGLGSALCCRSVTGVSIAFDLWGQRGWASAEVVGESHYTKNIRSVFGDSFKATGAEVTVVVLLVPEPDNPHDRNAIGVYWEGQPLGYLPREEAVRYAPVLSRLVDQGFVPRVNARVWASEWDDFDGKPQFQGSVRLQLAEPHMLVPANMPPHGPRREVPLGSAIQVSGEEHHLDALLPWLRQEGECWVHATLHEIVEQTARSSRTVVEVRIEDRRVGQLTPRMSGEMLPVIRHLAERGETTVVRAIVKGNRIRAEVILHAARAHELNEDWLDGPSSEATAAPSSESPAAPVAAEQTVSSRQGARPSAAVVIPPPPTAFRFNPPPGWPPPPPGWSPPPGWTPDASWPLPPDDWAWWIAAWDDPIAGRIGA